MAEGQQQGEAAQGPRPFYYQLRFRERRSLEGDVGDTFLLFYRPGMLTPGNILDSYGEDRGVTQRTRDAFGPHSGRLD